MGPHIKVWTELVFYVVLQFRRTAKLLQPEEQSSGLDNQVIFSTIFGCYFYLFGVEPRQQQEKEKNWRAGQPQ